MNALGGYDLEIKLVLHSCGGFIGLAGFGHIGAPLSPYLRDKLH